MSNELEVKVWQDGKFWRYFVKDFSGIVAQAAGFTTFLRAKREADKKVAHWRKVNPDAPK